MRTLTYTEAILEATTLAMEADPRVLVLGIGVSDWQGSKGTTLGLAERFGSDRCRDVPLSEEATTGAAVGMAMAGLKPIQVHSRIDFALCAANQLLNCAAKVRQMFGGKVRAPFVVRATVGRSWGQGAQHSQGLGSLFASVPGLNVVCPATPADAKGLLLAALDPEDPEVDPTLIVEHRILYGSRGEVPEGRYETPSLPVVRLEGEDVTIAAYSVMVPEALRAAGALREVGVSAEVVDLVSLSPLDLFDEVRKSAGKTGALLLVDCGWLKMGVGAEMTARLLEGAELPIGKLSILRRLGFAWSTCPTAHNLEAAYYPDARKIARTAFRMTRWAPGRPLADWDPGPLPLGREFDFRGPF